MPTYIDGVLPNLATLLSEATRNQPPLVTITGTGSRDTTAFVATLATQATSLAVDFRRVTAMSVGRGVPLFVLAQILGREEIPIDRPPIEVLVKAIQDVPGPMVIAVTDAHHADAASMRCLFELVRRDPTGRLIVLLAGRCDASRRELALPIPVPADLPRRHIWLGPQPPPEEVTADAGSAETSAGSPWLPTPFGSRCTSGDRLGRASASCPADPVVIGSTVAELVAAVSAGRLDSRGVLDSVEVLLWFGYDQVVTAALTDLDQHTALSEEVRDRLRDVRSRLAFGYPATSTGSNVRGPDSWAAGSRDRAATESAASPGSSSGGSRPMDILANADRLLSSTGQLGGWAPERGLAALTALIASNRLDRAEYWCDTLLSTRHIHDTPWLPALFIAVKADIALRFGDLGLAGTRGRAALSMLPLAAWGVAIALPLSILARVDVLAGRTAQAAAHFQVPVPAAVFRTPTGLLYLRARGLLALASGSYDAALVDFRAVGELMRAWRLDFPAFLPWRTDAAQALLMLGNSDAASRLAEEQLDLAGRAAAGPYAAALRILAACSPLDRRRELLDEAVTLLQPGGDRVELARALTELSRTLRALGNVAQARTALQRAEYVLRQSGVPTAPNSVFPYVSDAVGSRISPADPSVELSRAEMRVARLAVRGQTNRQIAETLGVTLSTVEQHLTRVYRKLNVSSRADLPLDLSAVAN